MKKAEVVEFVDGTYGIRRKSYLGGWEYYDFASRGTYWWPKEKAHGKFYNDCHTNFKKAKKILCRELPKFDDPGTPVDLECD